MAALRFYLIAIFYYHSLGPVLNGLVEETFHTVGMAHYMPDTLSNYNLTRYMHRGCVVQWVERHSQLVNFPCPTLGLQLTGDHLCG